MAVTTMVYGGIRELSDGTFLPLVRVDGGFTDPPPGEPSMADAHEAADRSRELGGASNAARRRFYYATPVVCE